MLPLLRVFTFRDTSDLPFVVTTHSPEKPHICVFDGSGDGKISKNFSSRETKWIRLNSPAKITCLFRMR